MFTSRHCNFKKDGFEPAAGCKGGGGGSADY